MNRPATALELVLAEPQRFDLGPAIRLLGLAAGTPNPLAGGDRDAAAVRVRPWLSPTIALNQVEAVERAADGRFDLTTPVLNVAGPTGELPAGEWRQMCPARRDEAARRTHRLVAEWYAAWAAAPWRAGRFAAAFARPRSAAGREAVLTAASGLPVRVNEAVGGWAATADLGGRPVIAFDPARCVELVVGPVGGPAVERLLPGGRGLRRLLALTRRYAGPVPRFRVTLRLRPDAARPAARDAGRYDRGFVADGPAGEVRVLIDACDCEAEERR